MKLVVEKRLMELVPQVRRVVLRRSLPLEIRRPFHGRQMGHIAPPLNEEPDRL